MRIFDDNSTNQKIFKLLDERKMSTSTLAHKLGISQQAISKWRNGRGTPSTDNLVTISGIFNVGINEIVCTYEIPDYENEIA